MDREMDLGPTTLRLPKLVAMTTNRATIEDTLRHLRDAQSAIIVDGTDSPDVRVFGEKIGGLIHVGESELADYARIVAGMEEHVLASAAQEHNDPWAGIPGYGNHDGTPGTIVYQLHRAGWTSFLVVAWRQVDGGNYNHKVNCLARACLRGEEWATLYLMASVVYKKATGYEAVDFPDREPLRVATYLLDPR